MRNDDDPAAIFASDGVTIHRLHDAMSADGLLRLADAAGQTVAPWEVELLRWPSSLEAVLRRSGYRLTGPPEMEMWCNCVD